LAFHETGFEHLNIHFIFQMNEVCNSDEFEIMVDEPLLGSLFPLC